MFWRALLSTASLLVAAIGVLVVNCSTGSLQFLALDPLRVCRTMEGAGIDRGLPAGIGLVVLAMLSLVAIWVPSARPGAEKRAGQAAASSLLHNLERLNEIGTQISELDDEVSDDDIRIARLIRRLETVEVAIESSATPSREVTQQWMALLIEANDLHNRGAFPTEEFKEVNTRLLDLFAGPRQGRHNLTQTRSG